MEFIDTGVFLYLQLFNPLLQLRGHVLFIFQFTADVGILCVFSAAKKRKTVISVALLVTY